MKQIANFIYNHYFLITSINAVIFISFPKLAIFEYIVLPLVCYLLLWYHKKDISLTSEIDLLFWTMLLWMPLTWVFKDYYTDNDSIIILRCVFSQISFMAFYFVGKTENGCYNIFSNSKYILLIVCLLGIYYFINPPSWMMNQIYNHDNYNGYNILEFLRLRSIFMSPYHIAYWSSLFIIYYVYVFFNKNLNQDSNTVMNFFILLVSIITLIFTMMRAPLVSCILSFFILLLFCSNFSFKRVLFVLLLIVVLFIAIIFFLSFVDSDNGSYLLRKIDSVLLSSNEIVDDRLARQNEGFHFDCFGDGVGSHAIYLGKLGIRTILDSEYVKTIVEQGYIGFSFLLIFLLLLLKKCILNIRELGFELCVIIFFIITMFGADSLSTADKHCFVFWLVAGRVSSFKPQYNKLSYYDFHNYRNL